ncbi:MAG: DUF192 domain-containing protein [Verrucomicrobiota bacterium]|nr:DUF192 domain-containing protein [Verrucomicrobiota bacterium]
MKLDRLVILFLTSATIFVSCQPTKTVLPKNKIEPNSSLESPVPAQAQPKLSTIKLYLGPQEMVAETALTGEQMQSGMMFRTNMAENESMIFVFPYPQRASFWMKNTSLPLSAAYIDSEGTIQEIHNLQPHNTNPVVAHSENIQFVLETRQNWFQRNNVSTGTVIRTEKGTLKNTFLK